MVEAHVIVVCSGCFPQTTGIILGLSRWNFSQPPNYFWHGMRCGLYLFFIKSKSPVEGAISEVVNLLCLQHSPSQQFIAFWMSSEQRPFLGIQLAEDLGNKAWETGRLLKVSYLLSKVPGKASFKWCLSFLCPARKSFADCQSCCVFTWNVLSGRWRKL